jgi:hypothetical protein
MTDAAVDGVAAERGQFIPVRKADLLDALVEHGLLGSEAGRARFREVCRRHASPLQTRGDAGANLRRIIPP